MGAAFGDFGEFAGKKRCVLECGSRAAVGLFDTFVEVAFAIATGNDGKGVCGGCLLEQGFPECGCGIYLTQFKEGDAQPETRVVIVWSRRQTLAQQRGDFAMPARPRECGFEAHEKVGAMGMLDVKAAVDVDRACEVLFGFKGYCALERGVYLLGRCTGNPRE